MPTCKTAMWFVVVVVSFRCPCVAADIAQAFGTQPSKPHHLVQWAASATVQLPLVVWTSSRHLYLDLDTMTKSQCPARKTPSTSHRCGHSDRWSPSQLTLAQESTISSQRLEVGQCIPLCPRFTSSDSSKKPVPHQGVLPLALAAGVTEDDSLLLCLKGEAGFMNQCPRCGQIFTCSCRTT